MPGPLTGLRVIDLSTVIAGPGAARHLADFGAEVIKVEAPGGDTARRLGWTPDSAQATDQADDDSYYWKLVGRGKEVTTLDLKTTAGMASLRELISSADALIENMRPGKLDALGLPLGELHALNSALVVLRVTAFGQTGPYANQPGFATLAEAMSGLASITGLPDGKPQLPPVALTDEITAIAGAYATMTALWHARETGVGQEVDVSLLETIVQVLGPLPSAQAHLGYEQPRLAGGIPYSVPRNTYRCRDDRWIAVSSSSDRLAARVVDLLGHADDDRFSTFASRIEHRDELEQLMAEWCASRSSQEAIDALLGADAAVAPVYSVAELLADEHVVDREVFIEVNGVVQQRPIARMSATPPSVRWIGQPLDGS